MREFVPGLPSKLPKVDLSEQEAEIEAWASKKGNKVTHLPDMQCKPRPTHRVDEVDALVMRKATAVVNHIRANKLGLTHNSFISMLGGHVSSTEIKRVIKQEMGLTLKPVTHYTNDGKSVIKMELR